MKVKAEMLLNTETKDYEIKFWNLSHPGQSIDYTEMMDFVKKVFGNVDQQVDDLGFDSDENITKMIN